MKKNSSNRMLCIKLLRFLFKSWTTIFFLSIIYWFVLFGSIAISIKWPLIWPLILFEAYVCFIFLCFLISWIIIILIIKNAKKNKKPLNLMDKIHLFRFPWINSFILYKMFEQTNEWDFASPMKTVNEVFTYFKFEYLPDQIATQECKLKRFEYLQTKFENVAVVVINDYHERYRVGSMNKNAILGKDYLLFERNPRYWNPICSFLDKTDIYPQICYFSLATISANNSLKWFHRISSILGTGNILMKYPWTFKGMVYWINKNFPQFNKLK